MRSDLSWASNTEYIVKRAYKKLWCLRRLKKFGANHEDLLDVYFKQIRSILEYAVAVWHPALTGEDRLKIERVQKSGLAIILGEDYKSYRLALRTLKLETLFTMKKSPQKDRNQRNSVSLIQGQKDSKRAPLPF